LPIILGNTRAGYNVRNSIEIFRNATRSWTGDLAASGQSRAGLARSVQFEITPAIREALQKGIKQASRLGWQYYYLF
jgi:hypothetical protein